MSFSKHLRLVLVGMLYGSVFTLSAQVNTASQATSAKLLDAQQELNNVKLQLRVKDAELTFNKRMLELLTNEACHAKVRSQVFETQAISVSRHSQVGTEAVALSYALWEKAPVIEVSWENPTSADVQEREWVRQAVSETWEKDSAVRFIGWGDAKPGGKGIRIRIADEAEAPHCKRLGRNIDGMPKGMVLNFTFANWCPDCLRDLGGRKGAIQKIAVHEFGHALDLAHEQNRSDSPPRCQELRQGEDGDLRVTIYDPESIMNYCNPKWNNDGKLSPLDIKGIQDLYGVPSDQKKM